MTEKFLDGPDIIAVFKQMGFDRMPECGSRLGPRLNTVRLDAADISLPDREG